MTRPRRCTNHLVATVAPSTIAVSPEPTPSRTPHSATSCQTSRMKRETAKPKMIVPSAMITMRLTPNRLRNTAANRARIVDVASRLFREKGFDGIGVADLMKEAGLTHGGFYGHFESKDHLA